MSDELNSLGNILNNLGTPVDRYRGQGAGIGAAAGATVGSILAGPLGAAIGGAIGAAAGAGIAEKRLNGNNRNNRK